MTTPPVSSTQSPGRADRPHIEPLSFDTLAPTRALLNRVFPDQFWWERSDVALPVSLYKDSALHPVRSFLSRAILTLIGIRDVRYWIARDGDDVVAVSGYYLMRKDHHEAVWAGWSCVDPDRRRGLSTVGGQLFREMADQVRKLDTSFIRLYTTARNRRMLNILARGGYREIRGTRPWWSSDEVRYLEVPVADVLDRLDGSAPAKAASHSG
jgi:hypothetical protein